MALVEFGRFERSHAYILVGRLESEDVPAFVFDGESNLYGNWLLVPVRVMVDENDLQRARELLPLL